MIWLYAGVSIALTAAAVLVLLRSLRAKSVIVYDPATGDMRRIPASKLPPGLVQRDIDGVPEPVWVDPRKVKH